MSFLKLVQANFLSLQNKVNWENWAEYPEIYSSPKSACRYVLTAECLNCHRKECKRSFGSYPSCSVYMRREARTSFVDFQQNRGAATCTHVHTYARAYLKKCRKLKNYRTKQNNRNIKQTGNSLWVKNTQSLHQLPLFFLKIKYTVFRKYQRSHVIGGLNVNTSVGKGWKLGG